MRKVLAAKKPEPLSLRVAYPLHWIYRDFLGVWYTGITFLLTLILGGVFLIYPFSGFAAMTIFLVVLFLLEGSASLWLSENFVQIGDTQLQAINMISGRPFKAGDTVNVHLAGQECSALPVREHEI